MQKRRKNFMKLFCFIFWCVDIAWKIVIRLSRKFLWSYFCACFDDLTLHKETSKRRKILKTRFSCDVSMFHKNFVPKILKVFLKRFFYCTWHCTKHFKTKSLPSFFGVSTLHKESWHKRSKNQLVLILPHWHCIKNFDTKV